MVKLLSKNKYCDKSILITLIKETKDTNTPCNSLGFCSKPLLLINLLQKNIFYITKN